RLPRAQIAVQRDRGIGCKRPRKIRRDAFGFFDGLRFVRHPLNLHPLSPDRKQARLISFHARGFIPASSILKKSAPTLGPPGSSPPSPSEAAHRSPRTSPRSKSPAHHPSPCKAAH